jgi:hypothetical protein
VPIFNVLCEITVQAAFLIEADNETDAENAALDRCDDGHWTRCGELIDRVVIDVADETPEHADAVARDAE